MSKQNLNEGDLYFIPLFLGDDYSLKSYSRFKFGQDSQEFYFCRIISMDAGSGILIEVFDCIGDLETTVEAILASPRLFDPVYIAGDGITKKRWRKVGSSPNYDKEIDSAYSKARFVMGRGDDRRVWYNGKEYSVEEFDDVDSIEPHKIWSAAQLENRLIDQRR